MHCSMFRIQERQIPMWSWTMASWFLVSTIAICVASNNFCKFVKEDWARPNFCLSTWIPIQVSTHTFTIEILLSRLSSVHYDLREKRQFGLDVSEDDLFVFQALHFYSSFRQIVFEAPLPELQGLCFLFLQLSKEVEILPTALKLLEICLPVDRDHWKIQTNIPNHSIRSWTVQNSKLLSGTNSL